eukprot:TRINITY_DN3080_c0_g2_i1.p1 TRINITY_DN3080_c0_g2~~TRINITY_DN3080_c0_g2_i1.p1  ORF type:complete len:639 (+),score=244.15 TRINITY_DN3080_c0_g2_i1:135-2051(+)
MSKKLQSPNDSIQQPSTQYASTQLASTRSGDQTSYDPGSLQSGRLMGGSSVGGGSYKSYILDHFARMRADIESTTRKLELEQRRQYKLDKELVLAEAEYTQKRLRQKSQHQAQDDAVQQNLQTKRQLERRLEKAISELNNGTCENERLREQIDQLRKERLILDTMFKQLERGIKEKGKVIQRVRTSMREDKLSCDEAKQKSRALGKIMERERKSFQYTVEKLKGEVKKQNDVQKQAEKNARDADAKDAKEIGGKGKSKRKYLVADEEEAFSEQLMHRRILKLSFLNTIQRRHIKSHQKNIEVFEQAFATIKSSTGIHEIEEIVKIFVGLEQRNFSLLTYVNTLNREIESIEIRNRDLQNQLKNYQQEQSDSAARKSDALSELTQQIGKTQGATQEKDSMIEDAAKALSECKPVIWRIITQLKSEIPALVAAGYDGDVPPLKVAPPDEHEENLNLFLMYIEEALMQFRVILPHDTWRITEMPNPKSGPAAAGVKRPNELPSAHIAAGDDSDDDPETGLSDRPLARAELRERAVLQIAKRKKKGGANKVAHEAKGGAESAADDLGEAPRRDGPPPPREYAASAASKESKEDSGGNSGGALSKSPSMSGRQGGDGAGPLEEGGDRDGMWWRGQGKEKKRGQ